MGGIRFNNSHSSGTNHNQHGNDNNAKMAGGGEDEDEEDGRDAMDLLGTWLKEYREDLDPLLDLGTRRDRYGAMMMMHGHNDDDGDDRDDDHHGVASTSMGWPKQLTLRHWSRDEIKRRNDEEYELEGKAQGRERQLQLEWDRRPGHPVVRQPSVKMEWVSDKRGVLQYQRRLVQ